MFLASWLCFTTSALAPSPLLSDLAEDHWLRDTVSVLVARGLLEGYPDGTFKGDRSATRWEMALLVSRLLARMENSGQVYAGRTDKEDLRRLALALQDELDALGARTDKLYDDAEKLDERIADKERIQFYGSTETVVVASNFYNVGDVGTPMVGPGQVAQIRPQAQGVMPVVDYQRSRALLTGTGFTSRMLLGLKIKASPDLDLTTQFAAYTTQGDQFVDVYWGASAPNLLALITATNNPDQNHQPYTSMVLDRFIVEHKPSRTRVTVGAYDQIEMDPLVYNGQPNLSVREPSRFIGYGFHLTGSTADLGERRLVWETFGSRWGEGNVYQGLDYLQRVLGADLTYQLAEKKGHLRLNWARLWHDAPSGGQPLLVGLKTGTNVPYGASSGWNPVQWVNPPGHFARQSQTLPFEGDVFVANTVDTRPIAGWNPDLDSAFGLSAGGGNFGPIQQNTYGVSGKYAFDFGLKLAGELATSDYRPNRNSSYSAQGQAWRLDVSGKLKNVEFGLDYLNVDPTYNPNLQPNGALGRRSPLTVQVGGRFHMHDTNFYPHNREGFRGRAKGTFERGEWWLNANFLKQVRTSLYDVRSPVDSLGAGLPNFEVLGFKPGFVDPVFYGYAHPNLYGFQSFSSFDSSLQPFEDQRGREQLLIGGLSWGPLSLAYQDRRFERLSSLPVQLGGSQNLVDMHTQFLSLQTVWNLDEPKQKTLRVGIDWLRSAGHLDPAGIYNEIALLKGSTDFVNLDSTQLVPNLGLDVDLNPNVHWGLTGRYYITKDHISSSLNTANILHPFNWEGLMVIGELKIDF